MKKCQTVNGWPSRSLKKTFLIMRIIVFLLLAAFLQTHANNAYAQRTKLSLNYNNTALEKVLDAIENQSEFFFLYNEKLIDVQRKVSIKADNEGIENILNNLFASTRVEYSIVDRKIVLAPDDIAAVVQQQRGVAGKVTDRPGDPLPGVTVVVKGTTTGTVTDGNGDYTLGNVPPNATLVFSFVGMRTQEVEVGNQTTIDVTMMVDAIGIEEVVAVGYGTQKKVNLTGSISTITGDAITNLPVTRASQALKGLATGVSAVQTSGQPGSDGASITIRGLGTFSNAGSSPLVLIDGMASTIDNVNPNNIESISILKDAASAAIYGARAANGVILIETKRGRKGVVDISYNGYAGTQVPIQLPKFVDSWDYAILENEAFINDGKSIKWTNDEIEKLKTGEYPDNYANTRHYEDLVTSGSGFQTNHNLGFMGGSDKHTYYFSLGYLDQEGIVEKTGFEKYSMQLNIDSEFSDRFKMKVGVSGYSSAQEDLASSGTMPFNNTPAIVEQAIKIPNYLPGKKSDGTYGHITGLSIESWRDSKSFNRANNTYFSGNIDFSYNILKSLKLTARGGYLYWDSKGKLFKAKDILDANTISGPSSLSVNNYYATQTTLQAFLDYNLSLDNHALHVLGGYSLEDRDDGNNGGSRDNFPNNLLYELNAGSNENMTSYGTMSEWALRSFFGRVNYSYKDRYLFEINARYDASSRFPKASRNGFFPSLSGAWRISEESFMKSHNWMDNLKIRASWGELGNQNIGNYPYQQVITLGLPYVTGTNESIKPGASVTNYPNQTITWETTRVMDIGVDFSMFNGLLAIETDYYNKETRDILYSISTSKVLGLTPSETNAGKVANKGFEIALSHRNNVDDFSYNIGVNYTYGKNEVLELANVDQDIGRGLFIGESLTSVYTYVSDGLFIDKADVNSYPDQPYVARPGDIRLKDISGPDGVPDGVVDPTYDRTIIGNSLPKHIYSMNVNAEYKGFDFNIRFNGVAGLIKNIGGQFSRAFQLGSSPQKWMMENRWSPEDPDRNAQYFRMTLEDKNPNSSYWYWDTSYLKLNNLELGYTLPDRAIKKIGFKKLRLYVSGNDLFVFHKFFDGWDPEMASSSRHYPTTSVYVFGINANF